MIYHYVVYLVLNFNEIIKFYLWNMVIIPFNAPKLQRFIRMLKLHKDFKAKKVLGTHGYLISCYQMIELMTFL